MLGTEGYKMVIIMPCNMSEERKKIFEFYGAKLMEVEAGDFDGAILLRDSMCEDKGWFNCNQFHNELNIKAHYIETGPEIYNQLTDINQQVPDALILGTGTGGTIMGTGKFLRENGLISKLLL